MSTKTTGDTSLMQDEDMLRKMWQETDDFGKKKEIRSHMYKIREARLKDFYNAGEETTSSSENRQHSTSTTSTTRSSNTGLKGSDLMMHADNLADHSFLSLKSKEIRDSESPTKDSYKITESRKINDRDWNVIETNEASKDGKMHTTSRLATTSGKQDLDGGELNYAAKSQQKASVYKDGDDKNFTKATEASLQNVIKQEAFGGDDNSKFHSTSTTSTSSSKFASEHRSTTEGLADHAPIKDSGDRYQKVTTTYQERPVHDTSDKTVVRKVYTENIPNELKSHPNYVDGNTKVTTETKTLPDGSTVTTTRYETKGATQYGTSSSSTTSSSKRHVSSSDQSTRNVITSHTTTDDSGRNFDDRATIISDSNTYDNRNANNTSKVTTSKQTQSKTFVDKSNVVKNESENRYVSERDVKRIHDATLIGRDTKDIQNIDVHIVKSHESPNQIAQRIITTVTKDIQSPYGDQPTREANDTGSVIIKTFTIPTQDSQTTTTKSSKTVSSKYDKQQVASTDFINVERQHIVDTKASTAIIDDVRPITSVIEPTREVIEVTREVKSTTPKTQPAYDEPRNAVRQPTESVEVEIITTKEEYVKKDEPKYAQPSREPIKDRKPSPDMVEIEIIPPKDRSRATEPKYDQPERRQPIKPGKSELDDRPVPTDGQYETTYRTDYIPKRISVDVSPTHDAFARSLRSISPDRISKTGSIRSLRTTSSASLRSTSSPDRHLNKPRRTSPANSRPLSPQKKSKSPEKYPCVDIVTKKRQESPQKKSPEKYTHLETVIKKRPESPEKKSPYVSPVTKKRPESPEKKSSDYSQRVIGQHTRGDESITRQTNNTLVVNTDTITRRKKTTRDETEVDKGTLTKKQQITQKPRSRSTSPTSIASDIEFIKHGAEIVTDLDVDDSNKYLVQDTKLTRRHTEEMDKRSKTLESTDTRKLQRVTDKSATLPLTDVTTKKISSSPTKDSPKTRSPGKEPSTENGKPKSIRRTDTYQQRCEEILGISDVVDQRKSSLPNIPGGTDQSPTKPKDIKKSPEKQKPSDVQEFPSKTRKSLTKEPQQLPADKMKGTKQIPSQEPTKPTKSPSSVQEFPSQIRKPTQQEPIEPYLERPKHDNQSPSVKELPSQIRKSPVKEPLEPYPERPKGDKYAPLVQEFPSQTRKSPVKEPLEPYPERPKDDKSAPSVKEFPSQTRKSPVKQPLEPYPEKPKGDKPASSVQEFPSQTRKSPVKEPLEAYPERPKGAKSAPSVQEFPSQTRKSPVKEPLEPYPERPKGSKSVPSVQEFPSQIRKTPEKEPLEPYPEKLKTDKQSPSVHEFPSQIRRPIQKELLEPYPEKPKDVKQTPSTEEFPSQIRKSPQKEPIEPYPHKPERPGNDADSPKLKEFPSQTRDVPSQVKKSPEKGSAKTQMEKPKDVQQTPSVMEFPPLIRTLPETQHPDSSAEKPKCVKQIPEKQTEKLPYEKEYPEYYPKEPTRLKDKPLEKSANKVSLDDLPSIKADKVSLDDIPSATRPERVSLHDLGYRPEQVVDNFITNEKVDTQITLKKYKDDALHRPKGIPDTKTQGKIINKKTKKDKISSPGDETESTTEEEEDIYDLEDQIIEDICDIVKCENKKITDEELTKIKTTHQTSSPIRQKLVTDKKQTSPVKSTPKSQKPREKPVEDFITITKAQLLDSKSKTPVEERIYTKKFINELCDDEEDDRIMRQLNEKEITAKNVVINQSATGPNRTVKKDHPDRAGLTSKLTDKKKQTELLIRKEKMDTNKSTVDTRRMDIKTSPKGAPKKTPDENKTILTRKDTEKKVYQTEYTDEYGIPKDKKVNKLTPKVSTPVKQTKKIVTQDIDISKDSKFYARTEKIDTTTKRTTNILSVKQNQVDKKSIAKRPVSPYKKPEDQQPKQLTKLKTIDVKQPRTIVKTTKTVEVQPTKRHVVSTIINIKPKTKPETITKTIHKTTVTRTINAPKTSKTTPKNTKPKQKPITNGHISTEDEESDSEYLPVKDTRRVTERVTPIRKSPFTKSSDTSDKKKHCITTKSILIENAVADQREIIVDLKRSKSSREGTPDRICPYPVNVDADLGSPRYPDRVTEPDDGTYRSKPKRVSDIPISETEDVTHFNRIKDVTEETEKTMKRQVETTDECLLSVNEKVSKFLSTAEQVTKKPMDMRRAPKVERPRLEVDDTLKEDECLLSVSDKVQKFLTTAEQLTTSTKEVLEKSKSPKYKDTKPRVDDEDDFPKPTDRTTTIETVHTPKEVTKETIEPRKIIKTEQITITRRSMSPEKRDTSSRPKSYEPSDHSDVDTVKYRTPERKPSDSYIKKPTEELVKIRKDSLEDDGTPKTSRRLSKDDAKTVLSPTGRLRSTETIKKAKALFENYGKDQETRQKDILNRPSVFEGRKFKQTEEVSEEKKTRDVRTKLTYEEIRRSPSPAKQSQTKTKSHESSPDEEIPHYMTPLDRTVKEHKRASRDHDRGVDSESNTSRSTSTDRDIPHYMLPLDRSIRERSPHKENLKQLDDIMNKSFTTTHSDDVDMSTTKFGVTLKRTDSGRMLSSHRKTSTSSVDRQVTEEIEEIFDLEYLEKLLETIVGYDIRRRIRAQIRIVKRAIEENTLEHHLLSKRLSPSKDSPRRQPVHKDEPTSYVGRYSSTDQKRQTEEISSKQEYRSSYQRKTSSEISSTTKTSSPIREASPKKLKDKSLSPDRKSRTPEIETIERKGSTTTTTTSRLFHTDLKKIKPVSKNVVEDKPEWVTQRTLRKVSETSAPIKKTVTTTVKKTIPREENPNAKPTDVITSGYGVGPTDENGAPLFGLKALRTQHKSDKTKVQGTVIRSQYYSENGEEPQGEISVTKYSTDPSDLGTENVKKDKGISSVTTTQKFGYKGTPTLKTITGKAKKTPGDEEYKSSVKTSKVTRRGSVKEISQKFIENAVDTLKNERQSSYPKAGLILRTSSFKDTPSNDTDSSREGSPATHEVRQKTVTTVESTTTSSGDKKAESFLTNKTKVTDVQDVISRMKTQDVEIEETEEDAEARNLLNKFIGSQVLLSGMESHVSKAPVTVTVPSGSLKTTTKITTTTSNSESSKPTTTVTRTFTHPITPELLQTVWDEQTLKLLLEQSTDYEDRRIIRARLREVMAEQEACADLVEKASDEAAIKESGSTVHEDADEDEEGDESESDDEATTVKTTIKHETVEEEPQPAQPIQPTQPIPPIQPVQQVQPQPDLILQTNPIYNQPQEQENNLSDNDEYPISLNEKANRFNSKKLRMKRANTIDIPKPLKYYECDDEDSENEDLNTRRNSYLALRGPIHIGKLNVEKRVPEFEPKTASDKKFMAFLGRNTENDNVSNAPKLWSNQQQTRNVPNWGNRFGNIKNNFEKVQTSNSINSARNFWKSADDSLTAGKISHMGPKISRQSARNLQQMFEEKQKQSQQQSNANINEEDNIVTGYLKVDTKSNKNIKVMTQPNPVNKFSHAPLSAFKPVGKKIEAPPQNTYLKPKSLEVRGHNENSQPNENKNGKTSDSPMYLYSPKPLSPEDASPVNVTPWHAGRPSGESRVLSLVASKFENHVSERAHPGPAPFRKMSKEKITIPPALMQQQNQPQEKLTAPYLVKSVAQNSAVRKLSGQYDSMGNRDNYPVIPNNKYQYDTKPRMFVPGENYTIKYDNQAVAATKRPEPKIYNAEYTITQQHYAVPQPIEKNNTQFAPVEPVQNQKEIYHKPQYNRRQSYEQVQIHNQLQQQQIHSKVQQRRDESPPVTQPESLGHRLSYTQPEIYNEPTVQNEDDQQYTSSFQFQPQIMPKTVKINEQPDVIESSKVHTQKEASKSWDEHTKENYYGHFTGDAEREETERVFANEIKTPHISKTNDYSRQSYDSSKSVSYKRQTSQENVKEYTPVSSKVMTGPVSQQAVTIQQNAPKTRDQYDMEFNLKSTLQKFSAQLESKEQQRNTSSHYQKFQSQQRKKSFEKKPEAKEDIPPPQVVYNNVKQRPSLRVNDQPLESLEINERGESVLTSKFHIPVKQTMLSPPAGSALSKSESWHQICVNNQTVANKPSPRASPSSRAVTRSKSSHSLDVPKMFEAGMSKMEMSEKRKTMEAYFGGAPQTQTVKTDSKKVTSSINRVKTSQKVSTQRQNSTGLCRSKTLPDIVCSDKLDDNNIDAIFEDLFNSRTTTTRTYTEGPVTSTSQVTTRISNQQQQIKKPMSPFAKFRQLDKQNSLNSPPSTPKSPTSGGPLFKFTDPTLNQSANTVKQRLLQWCQMKTKEYENIQLDNFSTSWSDGMGFCALIHHFLPDAFDYNALNPKNRRHNFTLAFRVADEKAGIAPLLDVDDMVTISKPDWKCVFTYVQSIYRRFKDED